MHIRKLLGAVVLAATLATSLPALGTVSTTATTVTYTANGSTTTFTVPFRFLASSDLVVTVTDTAGNSIPKALSTDYSVSGAASSTGGTVTFTTAPANGYVVKIARSIPLTQPTSLRSQTTFSPTTHEAAFDRLAMQIQQVNEKASAQVTGSALINATPITSTGSGTARSLADRFSDTVNVKDYGAKCDGTTDDTLNIRAAIASRPSGGEIIIPNSRCRITSVILLNVSNMIVRGSGPASEIYLDSAGDQPGVNDRAVFVLGSQTTGTTVTGPLTVGQTTLTVASASGITAGSWLNLQETDVAVGDIVYFDMVRVASVVGTTVTLSNPLRSASPGFNTITAKVLTLATNITVRDLKITTSGVQVGLIAELCRGITFDNIVLDAGKALATYIASKVNVTNVKIVRSSDQTSEFATTVDLVAHGNQFLQDSPATGGITIDLGTGFFDFSGNTVQGVNIGILLQYNVHDGIVAHNAIAYVSGGSGSGIVGRGAQRVAVVGNTLIGGAGRGISFANSTGATNNVTTSGNFIAGNSVQNFTAATYDGFAAADTYLVSSAPLSVGSLTTGQITSTVANGSDALYLTTGQRVRLSANAIDYIDSDGTYTRFRNTNGSRFAGNVIADSGKVTTGGSTTLKVEGTQPDGAVTGVVLNNSATLSNTAARLAEVQNNGTRKFSWDANGAAIQAGVTFSNLSSGSTTNGTLLYCSDCTIANPCASGGTGAFAKRLNGIWICN